jgi:hypothetical protein
VAQLVFTLVVALVGHLFGVVAAVETAHLLVLVLLDQLLLELPFQALIPKRLESLVK